jgi:hypothetical protein
MNGAFPTGEVRETPFMALACSDQRVVRICRYLD